MRHISYVLYIIFIISLDASKLSGNSHMKRDVLYYDAFGQTNYGFICADRIYPQYHLYATAKKACDIWQRDQEIKIPGHKLLQTLQTNKRDAAFFHYDYMFEGFRKPYLIYPILTGEELYEENKNMNAGLDRIVVDSICELVMVLTLEISPKPRNVKSGSGRSSEDSGGSSRSSYDKIDLGELIEYGETLNKPDYHSDSDRIEYEFQGINRPSSSAFSIYSPERNTPGRNTPGRTTPGRNIPGRNTPGRNTPGRHTPRRNSPGQSSQEDNTVRPASPVRDDMQSTVKMCSIMKRP